MRKSPCTLYQLGLNDIGDSLSNGQARDKGWLVSLQHAHRDVPKAFDLSQFGFLCMKHLNGGHHHQLLPKRS